jgi:nitroreductase
MKNIIELVKKRSSYRTYTEKEIEPGKIDIINEFTNEKHTGPFGGNVRFALIDTTTAQRDELKTLGTYGMIKDARYFFAGAVEKKGENEYYADFGFCMEEAILMFTSLDLNTCWMGVTFDRAGFSSKMGLSENEIIPCITPVGYAQKRRRLKDNVIRLIASSAARKGWNDIFYFSDFKSELGKHSAGRYFDALECVRLAPSASNKQPWRIVKAGDTDNYHFYLENSKKYAYAAGQYIDIGIAMCHFELTCRESGLKGGWKFEMPEIDAPGREYIVTWKAETGQEQEA